MEWSDIDEWASRNHGLITRERTGLSEWAWRRALRAGRLERVSPGVARLPGTARTRHQQIASAVLAAGPNGLASHRSAAFLHGIPRPDDDPVDVIVDRPQSRHQPKVVVHRPTDRDHLAPHRIDGIRCTNILRTMCDLGAVDPRGVNDAVGHVLSTRLATLDALATVRILHSRRGRAGLGPLQAAIENWSIDAKPADSVLELVMNRLVRTYGLPPVRFHERIEGWEVDFRVVGSAVLLECDGWAFHGLQRNQFERDRQRDAELTAAGWIVIRFTYRAITRAPTSVARRIRVAVERWSGVAPPDH